MPRRGAARAIKRFRFACRRARLLQAQQLLRHNHRRARAARPREIVSRSGTLSLSFCLPLLLLTAAFATARNFRHDSPILPSAIAGRLQLPANSEQTLLTPPPPVCPAITPKSGGRCACNGGDGGGDRYFSNYYVPARPRTPARDTCARCVRTRATYSTTTATITTGIDDSEHFSRCTRVPRVYRRPKQTNFPPSPL